MIRQAAKRAAALLAAIACLLPADPGRADEIRVLAAGAVQKAIERLIPPFEATSGRKVRVTYDTVGSLRDRVLQGDAPDIVILSEAGLKALADKGRIVGGAFITVGRTGVGLCAPLAAPALDISTPENLKAALLGAASIAHADPARGATAGTHFRKVIEALGIAGELGARITVVPFGGAIAADVAAGKFAIGVSQATEIVPNPNVRFLGTLPEPHALWTAYGAAHVATANPASAAFLTHLSSPDGASAFQAIGFSR